MSSDIKDRFERAVVAIESAISPNVKDGVLDFPRTHSKRPILLLSLGVHWIEPNWENHFTGYWLCSDEAARALLNLCEAEVAAFEICRDITAHRLMNGWTLPPALKTFNALFMAGQLNEPKDVRASITWMKNMYLLTLAKSAAGDFDLTQTRGDENTERFSACDAVVEGLRRAGFHTSYRAVKDLCVGSKPEQRRLRAEWTEWVELQRRILSSDETARAIFSQNRLGVGLKNLPPT